jgi:hypothetical protein
MRLLIGSGWVETLSTEAASWATVRLCRFDNYPWSCDHICHNHDDPACEFAHGGGHRPNLTEAPGCANPGIEIAWRRGSVPVHAGLRYRKHRLMRNRDDPLSKFGLEAIDLRWTLKDIITRRWPLTPISPQHLATLIDLGLSRCGMANLS